MKTPLKTAIVHAPGVNGKKSERSGRDVTVEFRRLARNLTIPAVVPVFPADTAAIPDSLSRHPVANPKYSMLQVRLFRRIVNSARALRRVPSKEAFRSAGLVPHELVSKEGLALINGTHLMAARACLTLHDTERLLRAALVAGAMSVDGCRGSVGPFDGQSAIGSGQ